MLVSFDSVSANSRCETLTWTPGATVATSARSTTWCRRMLQRGLAWWVPRKRIWTGSGVNCQTWVTCTSTLGSISRPPDELASVIVTRGCGQLRCALTMLREGQQYQRTNVHTATVHARQGVDGHVAVAGRQTTFASETDLGTHVPAIARAHDAVCCHYHTANGWHTCGGDLLH